MMRLVKKSKITQRCGKHMQKKEKPKEQRKHTKAGLKEVKTQDNIDNE